MSPTPTGVLGWRAAAVATGLATLGWSTLIERRWYALRHAAVPVLRPGASRPLRVLHLSDLHHIAGQLHLLAFVRACADTAPDVVAVSGDLLEEDAAIDDVVDALAAVARDRVGIAVLGAHDYWGSTAKNPFEYFLAPGRRHYGMPLDTVRLIAGLSEAGYHVVHNRRTAVSTPAGLLDVAGLGDPHIGHARPDLIDWSAPTDDVALRLGLVHAPYRAPLDVFDRNGFDLVLSGHTHGGQVRIPLLGALVNNCDLPLRQSRGLSRQGADLWLHVSAGLGNSKFAPVRLGCRPEATLLDLVARHDAFEGHPPAG